MQVTKINYNQTLCQKGLFGEKFKFVLQVSRKLGFHIVEEDDTIMSPKPQMGVSEREKLVEKKVIHNFTSIFGPEDSINTLYELFQEMAWMRATQMYKTEW